MAGLQGGGTDPCCGNGRISGGSAGSEHRYHYPGVDADRFDDASYGAVDRDNRWGGESEAVPESKANTMDGPGRGSIMGTHYPNDKWRGGFSA
jgi:hypothetical protein